MKIIPISKLNKDCAEIAHLTDINHHTEALMKLAQMVGNDKYRKILHHIDKIHDLEGHLPHHLAELRREIGVKLREIAEREFTSFEYHQIYEAF